MPIRVLVPSPSSLAVALSFLIACSGETSDNSSAGGGGVAGAPAAGGAAGALAAAGTAGSADGGRAGVRSFTPDPGCRSSSDCAGNPRGETCFRFGDGPGVCRTPSTPITECGLTSGVNECCSNADCEAGQCFKVETTPLECSASAGFDETNLCRADECNADQDCPSGVCTPAGYEPGRLCIPAACSSDDDCNAEPGGVCALLDLGCCQLVVGGAPKRNARIACVYPSDGCQSDSHCGDGEHCIVRDRAQCSTSCP